MALSLQECIGSKLLDEDANEFAEIFYNYGIVEDSARNENALLLQFIIQSNVLTNSNSLISLDADVGNSKKAFDDVIDHYNNTNPDNTITKVLVRVKMMTALRDLKDC